MMNCPCCSDQLLRHIRSQGIYWFCPSCRQEMPNFTKEVKALNLLERNIKNPRKVVEFNINSSRIVEKVFALANG